MGGIGHVHSDYSGNIRKFDFKTRWNVPWKKVLIFTRLEGYSVWNHIEISETMHFRRLQCTLKLKCPKIGTYIRRVFWGQAEISHFPRGSLLAEQYVHEKNKYCQKKLQNLRLTTRCCPSVISTMTNLFVYSIRSSCSSLANLRHIWVK